ncbi:MAG: YfhO family protein [Ruminococcus sp.]|nr:YfhO family protein [Ruminococcus sp.]
MGSNRYLTKLKETLTPAKSFLQISLSPFFVMLLMLHIYKGAKMYPYGTRSISWCDMSQQVVPLMNQFKDILDGKSSMFLNFSDSGGMNFYGVFFFFLASPFTLLVKFVPKQDMMMFMNVLVMLKLMTCALTSSLCLTFTRKKLDPVSVVLLSVMYPFCGYTMMYYQNIIWLDMMYLFPLLVMSLQRLTVKKKPLMYTIVLSACMIVNYYIGYMVVVFVLLFIAVYTIQNFNREHSFRVCRELAAGSFMAALLTAFVWLPSLIQYFHSGRGFTTVRETLENSKMQSAYMTIYPMLMCLGFPIVIVAADIVSKRERTKGNDRWLIMLGLTLIPFFIEPVNKMWHTGNYMSFPCRYGFMTIYLMLYCSAYALEKAPEHRPGVLKYLAAAVCSVAAVLGCYRYGSVTRLANEEKISRYAYTLWGNNESFELILGIFLMTLVAYGVLRFFYGRGIFVKNFFLIFCTVVFLIEVSVNSGIYITYSSEKNEETNASQGRVYDLAGRIDTDDGDGGFTRVKSFSKIFNNNMIGALGYNSIAHYTSLNDRDYMETMRMWGYTGVWMETGSVGGTRLSDAALSIGYEINGGCNGSEEVYSSDAGFIHKFPQCMPMGVLVDKGSLDGCERFDKNADRTSVQELLSEKLLGEQIITRYEPSEPIETEDGKYAVNNGRILIYRLDIKGSRELYFECYDEFSNHLSEPTYDSFKIKVNGEVVRDSYPDGGLNGIYALGEYSDCTVTVEILCRKSMAFRSLGLFGLDTERFDELCGQTEGIGMTRKGGKLSGKVTLDEEKSCFISVPYNDGLKVKVNGKRTEFTRVFGDFIKIDLPAGENEVTVSMVPKGFAAGVLISVLGAAVLTVYLLFAKKLGRTPIVDKVITAVVLAASAVTFIMVYIYPLAVKIRSLETPPVK